MDPNPSPLDQFTSAVAAIYLLCCCRHHPTLLLPLPPPLDKSGPSDVITQRLLSHHPTFVTPLFFHFPILLWRWIMSAITPNIIINAAEDMVNLPQTRNDTFNWRWISAFGLLPKVCSVLWNKIDPFNTMSMGVHPKHLLWALCFLTVYDTEQNSSHRTDRVDKKTHWKWSELFVEAISYLECEVVSFFLRWIYCAPSVISSLVILITRLCGIINIWAILVTRHW